jgi:hypothetical protein
MPLGSLLPAIFLVGPTICCCEWKLSHRSPTWREAHFGIFAEIADENDFIDRGHRRFLLSRTLTTEVFEVNHCWGGEFISVAIGNIVS